MPVRQRRRTPQRPLRPRALRDEIASASGAASRDERALKVPPLAVAGRRISQARFGRCGARAPVRALDRARDRRTGGGRFALGPLDLDPDDLEACPLLSGTGCDPTTATTAPAPAPTPVCAPWRFRLARSPRLPWAYG